MGKRTLVKEALCDRKAIQSAVQRNIIPKIKSLLTQSILNQRQSKLTRQQVRSILGVQIPKVRQQGQVQQVMDRDTLKDENNKQVDMNVSQIGDNQKDGIFVKNLHPYGQFSDDKIQPQVSMDNDGVFNSTPQGIQDDKDKLHNAVIESDDQVAFSGDKKSQVQAGLADNPTDNIPTSAQQNVQQKQKEIEKMRTQKGKDQQWIKEAFQRLDKRNIYQRVGVQQQPGQPNLDIIPETFLDSEQLPIQNDQAKDHIEMPSAEDQGINDFLKPDPNDMASNMDIERVNAATKKDMAKTTTDHEQMVQTLQMQERNKDDKQEDVTEQEPGKQMLTQELDDNVKTQVEAFLKSRPTVDQTAVSDWSTKKGYDVNQVWKTIAGIATNKTNAVMPTSQISRKPRTAAPVAPTVKPQGVWQSKQRDNLLNQNKKLRLLVGFLAQNFSHLDVNKFNQLKKMSQKISTSKQLAQRYSKCGKILKQATLPQNKKKIFEGNAQKFSKIRQSVLNNRSRQVTADPQMDRMRQLAGL